MSDLYKKLFLALSGFLLILMPILSFDAGITDDERVHNEHGIRLMHYYFGTDTMAIANPMDAHGEWRYKTEPDNFPVFMNIYGGFFDMTCAFVYRYVTSHLMGEYESKHCMIALSGALLFILIGLIAWRLTGSWAAALLALLFSCLSPRLMGHSFDNPKDIPFAAAFAFGLYQIILLLQDDLRIRWQRILLLVISMVIAIDIRIGGLMLICYMLSFSGLLVIWQVLFRRESLLKYILPYLVLIAIALAAYFGASLFWPFAAMHPLTNPLVSLGVFSHFNQFNSLELFEGHRINNTEIPWYFALKWYYITFPVFLLSGLFLFILMVWWHVRDNFGRLLTILMAASSVVLPVVLVIHNKSNIYDDVRHLYFIMPGLIALCAAGWYWFFIRLPWVGMWAAIVLCVIMMMEPFLFMVRNHPFEVMYFSPVVGGVKGAFKQYEMDYWGFSLKAGLKWLDNTDSTQFKDRKSRVRLWYGEQLKIKYYTDKSKHLEYVLAPTTSADWDYWLELPAEGKSVPGLLENWPPANTVYQVMVDSVPLCAIVRNPMIDANGKPFTNLAPLMNPNDHMGRGLAYYNAKDYNKAIFEFKLLLAADSSNKLAYNNIVASYNLLDMYPDALELGEKVLRRYPDFELLRNNLVVTHEGMKKLKLDARYYSGLSYDYFVQGEFEKCIVASQNLLRFDPKSAVAYNNICASNNAIGNFKAAKAACEQALKLAPGDELVKNNMAVSDKGLKRQ